MTKEKMQVSKEIMKKLERYGRMHESWDSLLVRLMDAADDHDPFWNGDE